jgi:hypothetical protein
MHFGLNEVKRTNGCSGSGVFLIWRSDYHLAKRSHRASKDMKSY